MDFRHLVSFRIVAEELHFRNAAARLHMAQQPLSRQIKHLEEELGVRLFERTTRRVTLTAAGQVFLAHVGPAMDRLEWAAEEARRAARGEASRLRVGYYGVAMYGHLPRIVRQFRESHPGIELQLSEAPSGGVEQMVEDGRLDAGFVLANETQLTGVERRVLYSEAVMVALPKRHPLARRKEIALAMLAEESFVIYSRDVRPHTFSRIVAMCETAGFHPRIAQEAASEQAILGLVSAGVGIALCAASLARVHRERIDYRPLIQPSRFAHVALVWKRDGGPAVVRDLLEVSLRVVDAEARGG